MPPEQAAGAGDAAEPQPTQPAPTHVTAGRFPPGVLLRNGIHLAAASAFAFAQPLLSLLGDNPAFFSAHDSSRWAVIGFGLLVALGPPLVALAFEVVAGLISPQLRWPVHLAAMWFFISLFALQGVRHSSLAPFVVFLIAGLIGLAVTAFYATERWARQVASVLGLAPIAFLVLFIFFSPTHKITIASASSTLDVEGGKTPPIIFVQFDEFPEYLLMDGKGQIDAKRFPNFARLAQEGTWYRNATTAHENTVFSVPSILDGRWPKPSYQPILADHPNNLFTLLGKQYHIDAYESVANLCPPGICSSQTKGGWYHNFRVMLSDANVVYQHQVAPQKLQHTIPPIDDRWANFRESNAGANKRKGAAQVLATLRSGQRSNVFRKQVARMLPGQRPLLSYMHILLPHEPRQYMPDGSEYQPGGDNETALDGWQSFHNPYLNAQSLQRDELQTQFTDRLIGEMIDHLKKVGLWKRAMVVVLADHGESFQTAHGKIKASYPGNLSWHRHVTPANMGQVGSIPMFIKFPDQAKGKTDERWVKSIDVLPTIASALRIKLPFHVDGRSLLSKSYKGRSPVRVENTVGKYIQVPNARVDELREQAIESRDDLFGSGDGGPGYFGIGPQQQLHNAKVSSVSVQKGGGSLKASLENAGAYGHVRRATGYIPTQIYGRLSGGNPAGKPLAVAINGVIRATGEGFSPLGTTKTSFSMFVPPSSFKDGNNEVSIYEISGPGTLRLIGQT